MNLRTGVDLVEIERLATLNPAIRQRFLQRVFTTKELNDAGDSWATLAGRFAAKEAVSKALRCGIGPIKWKEIEIIRGDSGEPILDLHGKAQEIAAQQGLVTWSISISHNQSQAVALVVALGESNPSG